jgi:hypothetical protein
MQGQKDRIAGGEQINVAAAREMDKRCPSKKKKKKKKKKKAAVRSLCGFDLVLYPLGSVQQAS